MTDEQLHESAARALNELKFRNWRCIGAGLVKLSESNIDTGMTSAIKPIVWLDFLDPNQQPHSITFRLDQDEQDWVKSQIVSQLNSAPASIRNEIDVRGDVSGVLVGVNTGVINKNSYEGDVYHQVQVYVLNDHGRASGVAGLLQEMSAPYKFLSPYTARDLNIFKGRDDEINRVTRIIHEQRLLVIHGEAGVGKTSLLAAGVIPKLIDEGLLVLQIQDYSQPVEVLHEALTSNKEAFKISLLDKPTLPLLLQSVVDATEGTLVLVLDQFDLLFGQSISPESRDSFIEELAQSLREIPPHLLRLFIVIRDESQTKLWELQERFPDLLRCQFQLLSLDYEQAETAIKEPLRILKSQVTFYGDLVQKYLVPDLGELSSGDDPRHIHPSHLQIVCTWLYNKAAETDPPRVIDQTMYLDEEKGADGILASYLERTLTKLEDERRQASRVMTLMAAPGVERWVLPSQLHEISQEIDEADIRRVLDVLVQAGLVVRRAGDHKYSFISPTIAREILRLAGPEVQRRNQAENELERVWLSWLARDALASREQLRYLAASGTHLTPRAIKTLLLLRSSVEQDEPAQPWLNLLDNEDGRALVYQLEELPLPADTQPSSLTTLRKCEQLLSLPPNSSPDASGNGDNSFGPLARNAINNKDSGIRQTCALALDVISRDKTVALGRLDQALQAHMKGLHLRKRRAELRGALADADAAIGEKNSSLSTLDQTLVWMWRARRRVVRDRRRWTRLMIGGALGAGLALGLLRAAIAAFDAKNSRPGIQFGTYFYFGSLLGGALALGLGLANPLLLDRAAQGTASADRAHSHRQTGILAAILGTVFFSITYVFVSLINGWSPKDEPHVALVGLVSGLGLSLPLLACLGPARRSDKKGWLTRMGFAGIVFGSIQAALHHFQPQGDEYFITIGWVGSFYKQAFEAHLQAWWPQLIRTHQNWPDWFGVIDAALMGIVLTAGLGFGLLRAEKPGQKRPEGTTQGN